MFLLVHVLLDFRRVCCVMSLNFLRMFSRIFEAFNDYFFPSSVLKISIITLVHCVGHNCIKALNGPQKSSGLPKINELPEYSLKSAKKPSQKKEKKAESHISHFDASNPNPLHKQVNLYIKSTTKYPTKKKAPYSST